ncbi:unnamed protein product [Closterium sp. Yama58-4]|nr:unnamed protein product [Closterium sp. Yama58-4]
MSAILADAESRGADPAVGESGLSQALLGSGVFKVRDSVAGPLARHVQRIEARLDPKLFPPPNNAVTLWDADRDGILRPDASTVEMQREGTSELSVELRVELKQGEEVYSVGERLGAVVGMSVATRLQVLKGLWNHIKANKLQDPSDPSSFTCDATLQAIFNQDKLKISSLPIHISPFLSPPPPLTITHRISLATSPTHSATLPSLDPSFHPLGPPTSLPSYETLPPVSADTCVDVTVTEAPALAAETARVIAAMGQQPEIDAIDAAVAKDAELLAKHRRRRAFFLAFSHSPGEFIRDLMVSQQRDLDQMQQGGVEGAGNAHAFGPEGADQDAEFYALPWVDDALLSVVVETLRDRENVSLRRMHLLSEVDISYVPPPSFLVGVTPCHTRFPSSTSPSPTLPPTVARASSRCRSHFTPSLTTLFLPSPTLPPTVAYAPTHRRFHTFPHRRPRFPPPSLTLSLTAAHAPSCLPPRFPTPSLAPSPTFPHASPHITHAFPHRRARFLPPSPTLSPTVALASSHRRPRFPPPSRSLPPTVAHAFPHRRARFLPPSPTLSPTVAHASSHRRPRFLSPSPTLSPTVAHASSHRRPRFPSLSPMAGGGAALEQSVGRTARAARAGGQQGVQCCRGLSSSSPSLFLPSSIYPTLSASLPSFPFLLPVLPPFLPPSLPAILPLLILPRSSPPFPFHLPLAHSLPHANPAPPFHPSSHPPILSSAHPLIRPSSLRRPHCLPLSLHSLPPSPTLPPHPCTLLSFSLILPSPRSSLIPCHTFTSLTFSHPPFLQASLLPTTLPPTLSFILLPLHPAALFFKLPSSDIPILRLSV